MQTLDDSQSDEIVNAVKGVIEDVNNHAHPNDAFIKIVKSGKFSPEVVSRMVEAFNQSKAVRQLEEEPEKRGSHFDLADPSVIFSSVYSADDTDSSNIPEMFESVDEHNFLDKTASVELLVYQTAEPYRRSDISTSNSLLAKHAALKASVSQAEYEEARHYTEVTDMLKSAASSMRMLQHEPYADFERRVQRAFGEQGKQMTEMVYKMANIKRAVPVYEKQATFLIPARSPYVEISKALDAAEKVASARNRKCILEVVVECDRRTLNKYADYELDLKDAVDRLQEDEGDKAPSIIPRDREYEDELKSIDLKTNVADIIAEDPIIRGYPIDDVLRATNSVVSVAPNAMMNKATLRAALHRTLMDHTMSVDEALQYAEADAGLRNTNAATAHTNQVVLGQAARTN